MTVYQNELSELVEQKDEEACKMWDELEKIGRNPCCGRHQGEYPGKNNGDDHPQKNGVTRNLFSMILRSIKGCMSETRKGGRNERAHTRGQWG